MHLRQGEKRGRVVLLVMHRKYDVLISETRAEKTDLCQYGKSWSREEMGRPGEAERKRSKLA